MSSCSSSTSSFYSSVWWRRMTFSRWTEFLVQLPCWTWSLIYSENNREQVRSCSEVLQMIFKHSIWWNFWLFQKSWSVLIYLRGASSLWLFMSDWLPVSDEVLTTTISGFSELWTNTTALKKRQNTSNDSGNYGWWEIWRVLPKKQLRYHLDMVTNPRCLFRYCNNSEMWRTFLWAKTKLSIGDIFKGFKNGFSVHYPHTSDVILDIILLSDLSFTPWCRLFTHERQWNETLTLLWYCLREECDG